MNTLIEKTPIIGVMGPGKNASKEEIEYAEILGRLIAKKGWSVLTGGVNTGVMHAALKGAKEFDSKCVTIGILPHRGEQERTSEYVDIPIPTGMGEGRNNLNVLTSNFIVCCCNNLWTSPGTMIEAVCAVKHKKPFIGLHYVEDNGFYRNTYHNLLDPFSEEYRHEKQEILDEPEKAIKLISFWLGE